MVEMNDLAKLSRNLYNGVNVNFNEVSGDDAMRNMIADALGMKPGDEIEYYAWEDNKTKVFRIIGTALDAVIPVRLEKQFNALADFRNTAFGDTNEFEVKDNSLLRVGLVAAGTQDLQRQQIFGHKFTVSTDWYGGKVYADFERFMAGKVDWKELVDRLSKSFEEFVQTAIYKGFMGNYTTLGANYTANGAYDEDKLFNLIQYIETASGGKKVAVYGSRSLLRHITKSLGTEMSNNMKDERNKLGYLTTMGGVDFHVIPQAFNRKGEYAIDDNKLLVLPQGEKLVAVVTEGKAIVNDTDELASNGLEKEFVILKKLGVQVNKMAQYGIYDVTR